jgi:hypothetical protein
MINLGKRVAFFILLITSLITNHAALASSIESLAWLPLLSANLKKLQPNKNCPQNLLIDMQVDKKDSIIKSSVGRLNWDLDCSVPAKSEKVASTNKAQSFDDNNKQIQLLLQQLSSLASFELKINRINLISHFIESTFSGSLSIQKTSQEVSAVFSSKLIKAQARLDLQSKDFNLDAAVVLEQLPDFIQLTDKQITYLNNDLNLHYQSNLNRWYKGDFQIDWQGKIADFTDSSDLSIIGQVDLIQSQISLSKLLFNAQQVMLSISETERWNTGYIKLKNDQPVVLNYEKPKLEALPISLRIGTSNLLTDVERGKSKRIRIDKQKLPPLLLQLSATGNENKLFVDWTSTLLNQKLTGNLALNPESISLKVSDNKINLVTLVESTKNYVEAIELFDISSGELKLDLSAQYNRNKGSIAFTNVLSSDDISGKKDNILFDGLTLFSHLDYQVDASKKITVKKDVQQINIENLFIGIPLQALQLEATLNAGEPIIQHFKTRLLGGRIDLDDFKMHAPSQTVLNLSGISLAEVIKYSAYPEIQGKGLLDGMLPLLLTKDGPEIADGLIFARAPGGYIKVPENTVIKAMGRGNPAFTLTMQILTNFQFDTLQGNIGYTSDGESDLKFEIKGISPTVSGTQPITFNYSHNENILKLLKSLRFNDELVRDIKENY